MQVKTKNLFQVVLLGAVFIIPLAGAFYAYYHGLPWKTQSVAHGQLHAQPLAMHLLTAMTADHHIRRFSNKQTTWLLLYSVNGHCDKICQDKIHDLNQVHRALGKEAARVEAVFLGNNAIANKNNPDITPLYLLTQQRAQWDAQLSKFISQPQTILIIDPHGNLVLSYELQTEPRAILRDLQRLLRVSHIG